MPDVLSQSHIVCLPTAYGEGVPRVLIEAAACGRACVATDMPGCRDVVKDGETGLLIPPGDPKRLAAALGSLLSQPLIRKEMGARARSLAESQFDVVRIVRETLGLYGKLGVMNRGRPATQ